MAGFNPFTGVLGGDSANPSLFDVERRKRLAQQLSGTGYVQNSGPIGALAQALGGSLGAYEDTAAANEQQTGYTNARERLAKLLSGGSDVSPGDLIDAGGDQFLPDSESGLVGDLIKRKLGIGETFYGTPQISQDANGKFHYYVVGSLGTVKPIEPPSDASGGSGGTFLPPTTTVNTGNEQKFFTKSGGVEVASTPINNAQAELDKAWGKELGTDWANAPANLQKEGNLVQQQAVQHQMVASKIDDAIKTLDANPGWMAGTVGSILSAAQGTPQYDLAQTLGTIKANIGFDQMQNMKDNSATGSTGLGQISNMEEQLLQAINGSLQQGQSATQLKANLLDIKRRIAQIIEQKKQAVVQDIQRYKSGPQKAPELGSGATTNLPASQLPQVGNTNGFKIISVE